MVRVVVGPVLLWTSKREDKRLANGVTYEPQTFVERTQLGSKGQDIAHRGRCDHASARY